MFSSLHSWYGQHLTPFEATVLVLLMLIAFGMSAVVHWLHAIAKILAHIGAQIEQGHINDLPSKIADGMGEHERRVEREINKDLIDLKS
jgi:hypothetical protein